MVWFQTGKKSFSISSFILIPKFIYPILLYAKVNPNVLIGSFLVRIPPYGPFPWKRSSAVYFFVFKSRQLRNKHGTSAI